MGNLLLGEASWIGSRLPAVARDVQPLTNAINHLGGETGLATRTARWWQANIHTPPLLTDTAAAVESTAARTAAGETAGVIEQAVAAGERSAAGGAARTAVATENFWARPYVRQTVAAALEGAVVAGGTVLLDHWTPGSDSYHFSTPGVMAALAMPGDLRTRFLVGGGSLVGGKILNWLAPASEHAGIANLLRPGWADTTLMTAALMLPADPRVRLATLGGAWMFGRMNNMDALPAAGTALGLGAYTFGLSRSVPLAIGVAAASYGVSRLLHMYDNVNR